ncbi:MAG: hypothetical protein ACR2QF_05040, partial [Geminicoccaceae bacterium]
AFTKMPEGPENALALITLTEGFREYRGDEISKDELKQINHAQTIASIVLQRFQSRRQEHAQCQA